MTKIRLTPDILADVSVVRTRECPAGTAYHRVALSVDGLCFYSMNSGAIYGEPDVIALLDAEDERDLVCDEAAPGARLIHVTRGAEQLHEYRRKVRKTHRQWAVEAASQLAPA